MSYPHPPSSLFEVLVAYEQAVRATEPLVKASAVIAQLKTALLRFTLPGWGFPLPVGQRLTVEEMEQGMNHLKQVSLAQLLEAPAVQQRLFEELRVTGNSQRNYRWALNKLLDWCQQQSWYEGTLTARESVPRKRDRKGAAKDIRLTSRKALDRYGLGFVAGDVIPTCLQNQLEEFYRFLVQPDAELADKAVRASTADQYLQYVLLMLGWLQRYKEVASADLSLQKLVEFVPVKSASNKRAALEEAQAAAERTVQLVQSYVEWLETAPQSKAHPVGRGSQSPHTKLKVFQSVLALARFVYREELIHLEIQQDTASLSDLPPTDPDSTLSDAEYRQIPVLEELRQHSRQIKAKIKTHQLVSDQAKKQLEWSDFLALVEVLRKECEPRATQRTQARKPRLHPGPIRSLTAIAQSYQRFLLAALLAYLPPQRQRVYRNLKLFDFRLDELQDLAAPLQSGGYLYQEGDSWRMKLFPDLYQQGKQVENKAPLILDVPDHCYSDGRRFYQYLKEWFFEYDYENAQQEIFRVNGLRSCFNPQHAYVFTLKNGQPYSHPAAFSELLRAPAYRITGKALTLDLLRVISSRIVQTSGVAPE